jgi:hypothetical protein
MAMLAFSSFEKSKNQFQLIRHLIHNTSPLHAASGNQMVSLQTVL